MKFNGDMEKLRLLSPPNTDLVTLLRQNPKQTSRMNTHGQFPKLALFLTQSNPNPQRQNQTFQDVHTNTELISQQETPKFSEQQNSLVHQSFHINSHYESNSRRLQIGCARSRTKEQAQTQTRGETKGRKKENRVVAAQIL